MQGKALLHYGLVLMLMTPPVALSATPGDPAISALQSKEQFQHQQQQQKAREARLAAEAPDIRIPLTVAPSSHLVFPHESPCFMIHRVTLTGNDALPHWLPLQRLANQAVGHCLGVQGINTVIGALQNRIIEHGWVTTRVLAPQQELREGELKLLVVPGRNRHVALTPDSGRYVSLWPAMPAHEGNLLDLRDIEQGLENLQRLPTVEARMELQPGEAPGESDIIIQRVQSRFWRVGAWVDDTGTESTGRYQGGVMLALDNPASLSDLFYVTASRDLGFAGRKSSKNFSGHYSVPFGYWALGLTASDYTYSRTIAGRNADILYSGKSHALDVQLSRVLHRGATSKTSVTWDVTLRETHNFIEDVEVENQRRRTSAWQLGLEHNHHIGPATLDASVSYQRGTRWFGAQPAWEEEVDDETYATALSKILTWDASLTMPFALWSQDFSWTTQYHRQMSDTPLTPQEEFSIGNRWTVRGFDGERTLSASRGWTLQNTLGWSTPVPAQELYLGADYGEVGGNSSTNAELSGQHLAGGVLGLRGAIERARLSYDLFSGIPLSKPPGFKTDPVTFGFSLNWNY